MKIKILINGITLEKSNLVPLLQEIKYFQRHNYQITLIGVKSLQKKISGHINFIRIKKYKTINSKFKLIVIGLKRNIDLLKQIKKFTNQYHVIYSRSSVLDLIFFPFFLKCFDSKIKWVNVFDNIVPISDPGNKITRFISWLFFQTSLLLLKKADLIFVISPELKQYLIDHRFNPKKLIITGNAIETDTIKQSIKEKYLYDALFIGRINETKGIFDMLQVLKLIKKTYPKFILAIMGDGDKVTKYKFKKQIKLMNLNKNIKLLGYISGTKKFNIIKSSRSFWFLSVSKSESFGVALMEAVVCGIPAFAYKLPVFTKIYKNNEVIFSPIRRTDIVAKKVLKLFSAKRFTNSNGKKLMKKYEWKNIIKTENHAILSIFDTF